jgi:hypothetical protein
MPDEERQTQSMRITQLGERSALDTSFRFGFSTIVSEGTSPSVKPAQPYTGERLFSGTLAGIIALPLISVHANR